MITISRDIVKTHKFAIGDLVYVQRPEWHREYQKDWIGTIISVDESWIWVLVPGGKVRGFNADIAFNDGYIRTMPMYRLDLVANINKTKVKEIL